MRSQDLPARAEHQARDEHGEAEESSEPFHRSSMQRRRSRSQLRIAATRQLLQGTGRELNDSAGAHGRVAIFSAILRRHNRRVFRRLG